MINRVFFSFIRWLGALGITPNQITVGRMIFFIPGWLLWIYKEDLGRYWGLDWRLLGTAAFSLVTLVICFDVVDGALARETGQVSRQGKILDPIVDKIITYATLALFWSVISHPGLVILLLLDLASTFLRGAQVVGANAFGKKKALAQNLAKLFFGLAVLLALPQANVIANLLIWSAVLLATISVSIRLLPDHSSTARPFAVLIPQALTLGNLLCGLFAMGLSIKGHHEYAATAIFAAMACDLTDGAVARKLGVVSTFGKHFDTCADLISFGCAPAVLAVNLLHWSMAGIVAGIVYILATGIRLWDYGRSKDKTPTGFFRGMPSPAGAWLVSSTILWIPPGAAAAVLVVAALLMCSFIVNWQHFSRALPTLSITEISIAMLLGALPALLTHPLAFLSGPILVYVVSPLWRRPLPPEPINRPA